MHFIYLFINIGKKFDTLQNNHILKTKISEIKYHSPNKNSPFLKPPFSFYLNTSSIKKNKNKNYLKTNIVKGKSFIENDVLEQNLHLSKRINEKNSVYSLSQWKKDFKKSRVYKKISCEYPSINFVKPKKNLKFNIPLSFPNVDDNYNIFKEIKFKPFTSFLEDEKTKRNDSFKKFSKNKKRHFKF